MYGLNYFFCFVFLCLFCQNADAGKSHFFFSALTSEQGLSHNFVKTIFQDADGYIWFGTWDGLNRYDGSEIKVYRVGSQEYNTVSGNEIRNIVQDEKKNLWILTPDGLDRMNPKTEVFRHYVLDSIAGKDKVQGLYVDSRGNILLLTNRRIFRYYPMDDSLKMVVTADSSIVFTVMAEGVEDDLYVGTKKHGVLTYSQSFEATGSVADDREDGSISHLSLDAQGRLWIFRDHRGIGCYVPGDKRIVRVKNEYYDLLEKDIRSVLDLDREYLLLGTFNGLFLLHKDSLTISPGSPHTGGKGELSHFSVFSLYKDRQGILWVGTNSGGVNYHHSCNDRFDFVYPSRFPGVIGSGGEGRDGKLWWATEGGGLLFYDPMTEKQEFFLLDSDERSAYNNNIIKSLQVSGDTIWCATHRGKVYLFSVRERKFRLFRDFGYNNIYAVHRDRSGSLWVATNTRKGLVAVTSGGKECNTFPTNDGEKMFLNISVIVEPEVGRLFLGSQTDGLYVYEPKTTKFVHISASELGLKPGSRVCVTSICVDEEKNIWLATDGTGLFVLDSALHLKKHYLRATDNPLEKVLFVTVDSFGYTWAMTGRTLCRLDRKREQWICFDSRNGIVAQDFTIRSGIQARDGKLYFPGSKGIVVTDPGFFVCNDYLPPVFLTSLKINNIPVFPGSGDLSLNGEAGVVPELQLKYNETNLMIGYTALNYINPAGNRYAYKLDGIDPDWVEAGHRKEAIYSNLFPGKYLFRVKASNNDGVWNQEGAALQIVVLSPLWARWWACMIYAIFFLFAGWKYWVYRRGQLEREKTEEFQRERLRFFTHITHEFRTPLTLILNPLDDLMAKTGHIDGVKDSLLLVRKNSQRLLSLVNNLMDIDRLENGARQLKLSVFDFNRFIREIYHTFQLTAAKRQITFTFQAGDQPLPVSLDREEVEKVFFNLLSNAFKFTPVGGTVKLSVHICPADAVCGLNCKTLADRWISIEVEDNGMGIAEVDRQNIFEPFAVVGKDLHGEVCCSGVGLNISKSIVEKHQGIISACPAKSGGTVMNVWLPCIAVEMPSDLDDVPVSGGDTAEAGMTLVPVPLTETLLLVDDHPDILEYLRMQLGQEYKILTASDGETALALLRAAAVDMVISDVMMPGMNGIELCVAVKSAPDLCHVPVVLLTAKTMTLHVEEGLNAGADDYLPKPFKISTLKARIRNILSGREKLKELYGKKLSLKSVGIEIEPEDRQFVEKYVELVKLHISEPDFDIEMLCRELGMSRANFYRKVKTVTALSPAEMIRNIRLECAAGLLNTSALTAAEVAFQVGFGSYNNFSTCFKAAYGVSPKEYKESSPAL